MEAQGVDLLANCFPVKFRKADAVFHEYVVLICNKNEEEITNQSFRRAIMSECMKETPFIYYGDGALFLVGAGADPPDEKEITFNITFVNEQLWMVLTFYGIIPISPVLDLQQSCPKATHNVVDILNIILRLQAEKRDHHIFQEFYYYHDVKNYFDIGWGVTAVRGFQSGFCTTKSGLALNIDVSTIMTLTPGPVITFLKSNLEAVDPDSINWEKAEKLLMNKRIKAKGRDGEFLIRGLSMKPRKEQGSQMEPEEDGDTKLTTSAGIPWVDVGTPARPSYILLEHCSLVPLQHYTNPVSDRQRTSLVEKSGDNPNERVKTLLDHFKDSHYEKNPSLVACGVSIEDKMILIKGRVLCAPTIMLQNYPKDKKAYEFPVEGRWNYHKKLIIPVTIKNWAVVNFSSSCNCTDLVEKLIVCATKMGIIMNKTDFFVEEERKSGISPVERVELMFKGLRRIRPNFPRAMTFEPIQENLSLRFILCVLDEKDSKVYGAWKKKCLTEAAVATQCISPTIINDQYLTNVLLKVNMKLGGVNFELGTSHFPRQVKETPTMILGMGVYHGSPSSGQSDVPSIATVVGLSQWPYFSKYGASVCIQTPEKKEIVSLYRPTKTAEDDGMIRELLLDFCRRSKGKTPEQFVIFRDGDGLSELELDRIPIFELEEIIEALDHLGKDKHKFTLIVSQKDHRTSLFKSDGFSENVPPGTVVDTKVVHHKHREFYMCAHNVAIGTSRPTRYRVLLDDNGFTDDELQMLVHSLSYSYQTTTSAISIVAPIQYARRAAKQVRQFFNFGSEEGTHLLEFTGLHVDVQHSMFFC
ncbi:hypothetical protein MKX01_000216 [Papaver californicum]|nr:hypothetical protein MKX01_000216 [Papaver californicum]